MNPVASVTTDVALAKLKSFKRERTVDAIRPNDEVNKCQSSKNVIPTAIHLAALDGIDHDLLPSIGALALELETKAEEFKAGSQRPSKHLERIDERTDFGGSVVRQQGTRLRRRGLGSVP